jgi:diadenosine tetraphosphate (Ap4A) HIT family hydrolase
LRSKDFAMIASGLLPESAFAPVELERIVYEDADTIAFYDRYPVSPGHTLVVAKTVTASLFDLPPETQAVLWRAVATVRDLLQQRHQPNGFNIGLNDGPAAGQTINHAHIHVIPRYTDDQDDPRGGVRWIFPDKARYWEAGS